MAVVEDAASVLEQFVQDVANLPAEIAHLLEEIEAKDKVIQECRSTIHKRDSRIQTFLKTNGASQTNPKDDTYGREILSNFGKAMAIQDEKVGLSEKASVLLDRQIKRLDIQIRTLQTEGIIAPDPLLPSLLHPTPGNRLPPLSLSATGTSTPLHPIHSNIAASNPSTTIAHSSLARLVQPLSQSQHHRHPSPATTGPAPPTPTIQVHPTRDSSLDSKRRRLNLPAASSSLRQSSLGPGTPKVGTPGAVRAGSAGPRAATNKKPLKGGLAPHQRVGHLNPLKKVGSSRRKGSRKGLLGLKPSPSDTGDDSALSEVDGSESEAGHSRVAGGDGQADVEMGGVDEDEEEGEGDDRKYCTCRSVSYGNMVACDNDDCAYEWFHWSCVGMTKEPAGKWYCEECRLKLGIKGV